jgi:L-asparagine transporter-like permease
VYLEEQSSLTHILKEYITLLLSKILRRDKAERKEPHQSAPRNFKVPCGPLFPVIGIVGTAYMILNISSDPHEKLMIWLVTGVCFIALGIYSALWIRFKMKMKIFKSIPLDKVLAMENDLYYYVRKSKGIWK